MRAFDEIAVERACYGDPVFLDRHERRVAVSILTAAGLSGRTIAERLRVSRRTVCRWRAKSREVT